MGLGKTVQASIALRLCLDRDNASRALIVTPASLRLNWQKELSVWAPNLHVQRVIGDSEDRLALYALPIPVLIASYDQVRMDYAEMQGRCQFDVVILDEAQRIKNSGSTQSLACKLIPRSRSWALTGTPVENSSDDLVSIFSFIRPLLLSRGLPHGDVQERIRPYFLRRRKLEVAPDLPEILVQDIPLELDGAQLDAYQEVWDRRRVLVAANGFPASDAQLLALITRLKQLCNYDESSESSVKLDALNTILDSATGPTDKVLVFSQYVETLEWLSSRISVPHKLFHGELSETRRASVVEEYETQAGPRALLISLRAGGVGLNLNSTSVVVMFDRWWNPAVENQAIQRAHRFGRRVPLQVVRFTVVDTIEERIAEILREKAGLFETLVERAENWEPTRFSSDELRRILSLSQLDVQGFGPGLPDAQVRSL
jgi:SNF2 family DNA or RNA helicase